MFLPIHDPNGSTEHDHLRRCPHCDPQPPNPVEAPQITRTFALPNDWPDLEFFPGQDVVCKDGNGGPIDGIKAETIMEDEVPPYKVVKYLVGARWYLAGNLSTQLLQPVAQTLLHNDFDPFLDSDDLP